MKEGSEILIKEMSSNGVLRLTMNNLDHKNALSETMMSILLDELKEASTDKSIRTIVLSANGNVFCSGHDLKEITVARANEDNGILCLAVKQRGCPKNASIMIAAKEEYEYQWRMAQEASTSLTPLQFFCTTHWDKIILPGCPSFQIAMAGPSILWQPLWQKAPQKESYKPWS